MEGIENKVASKNNIRNFCIIAHIDHGKSTLADRIIEMTNTVLKREMKEQLLDTMDLERERGITIKLQTVRMYYTADDKTEYEFNLIDTPGHADFNYEVSRSLAACEGALLVVDATQGVQAQTLANLRLAMEQNLTIIPVINKVDLANADIERVMKELQEINGIDLSHVILASAKTGLGIKNILEKIVKEVPAPNGNDEEHLQALVFDSHYDPYRGVVLNIRVVNGMVEPGMKVKMLASNISYEVSEVGVFTPKMNAKEKLSAGEVGYISTSIKDVLGIKVGDTVTDAENTNPMQLPGYKEIKQMVFAGLYPVDSNDQEKLKEAVEKLALNDSAFVYEPETSNALGAGFRCGFLGILHMEIVQERLEREYELEIISTAPSVIYRIYTKKGELLTVNNPKNFPGIELIDYIEEPYVNATIIFPTENIGVVMELCTEKRGIYVDMSYMNAKTVELFYELPLSEIAYDFFDMLKSLTHGYASVDYKEGVYKKSDLVKMDIWLNDESVDAFSFVLHRDKAHDKGRTIVERMKYLIPRKLYPMPVQSVIENKVVAREDIPPLRKSAVGKGYTGSMSKKKRMVKKVKENKTRQRKLGKADVPQEAFHAILNLK